MHRVEEREICERPGRHVLSVVLAVIALASVGLAGSLALASSQTHTEDFTTTTYKDPVNTTADWDTVAGELKLPPFVLSLAGSYNTPGYASDVAVSGDHAFVADGVSGLKVIDISDPTNPVLAGGYNTPGNANGIAVSGDHAFVGDGYSGLQVIDISDPTNPVLVGSCDMPEWAGSVAVSGDHAFVADGSGLQVVDISDPTNPVLAGSYDTSPYAALAVAVSGDHAFVANGGSGLQVIDISDPTNPVLAGSCDTPDYATGVAVSGDHAFVGDVTSGLQVIDISDPTNPVLAGSYNTPSEAYGVAVAGDHAFVADRNSGLQVIDISDPTNPVSAGSYDTPDMAINVAVSGEHAFVADAASGLRVIDISDPTSPVLAGSCDTQDFAGGVVVSGDHAFVADTGSGLQVIDISDPANPVLAGSYDTSPHAALGVAASGDHAFVAAGNSGLQVIDISDPTNPVLAGSCDTPDYASGVAVSGDHAFMAIDVSGFQVIDISDPTNPVLAGSCNTPGNAWDVAVSGNHAFLADNAGGLQVIDISDPTNPVRVGNCNTQDWARGVAVSGDHAFVADNSFGLKVIDISDPTNPVLAGSYNTPGQAYGVAVSGDHAFVADGGSGLQVIDISDPTNPVLAGSRNTPDWAYRVAVSGDHAFVADGSSGLQVILVYQSEVGSETGVGQSLAVDGGTNTIPRARLTSTQTSGVSWELSADGATSWSAITPDMTWIRISVPGDDLRWRSTHAWSGPGSATVSELTLDWLTESGPITSIADVPDDQGGWVRLNFSRSGYDFADEDSLPVTGYGAYRRVDDAPMREQIRNASVPSQVESELLSSFARSQIRQFEGHMFILGGTNGGHGVRGEFPPGVWEYLSFHPATQQDDYISLVPTTADSTAEGGIAWSVYLVTTHTTTPSIWFASAPDSGYSVDNIAPSVPTGLVFSGPETLEWDPAGEEDFESHSVYGSESEIFDETATLLGHTVDPTYDVSGDAYGFYHVTTSDHAGNESEAATIANPSMSTPDDQAMPTVLILHSAQPNPFRSGTSVGFDLPESGHVKLTVFGASGRVVRDLIDGRRAAGRYAVPWDGTDGSGAPVASGVYFYRLSLNGQGETRRMVLLR